MLYSRQGRVSVTAAFKTMPVKLLKTTPTALTEAVSVLRRGGVVAFPTDTVYGLGALASDPAAVAELYRIKERPTDKPFQILVPDVPTLRSLVDELPPTGELLAERFLPGGLTLVLQRAPGFASGALSGDTVALRIPRHHDALALLHELQAPLAATSANLAGSPSATSAGEVVAQLGERIALVLDGGPCPGGVDSTVLDLTVTPPRLLREGAVSRKALETVVGSISLASQ